MYQKTRELLSYIIQNWNYLDYSVKSEFVEILQYYKDLTVLSKFGS